MADDPSLLVHLGIKVPDLVAGFGGGVVNAIVFKRSDPVSIVSSMVVGAVTANYLAEPFARYLGTGQNVGGFLVGLAGMIICQGIVEGAKSWRPFGKGEDQK